MSRKIKITIISLFTIALGLFGTAYASGQLGSEDDPIVTKSYVDKKIQESLGGASASASQTGSPVSAADEDELLAMVEYVVKSSGAGGSAFAPVQVKMGQTIYGGEGAEMILRSGKGTIVTSTDTVVNATSGKDMKKGENVPAGNLLIFPRDDGRGVKTGDDSWFIVKGSYYIR